jgi:hypothetical protein
MNTPILHPNTMRRAPCFLEVVVRVFALHSMFVAMIALRIFTMQDEMKSILKS